MKKRNDTIDRIARGALACGLLLGLVLAGGERADGGCSMLWTLGWMAFAAVCGLALGKFHKNEINQ